MDYGTGWISYEFRWAMESEWLPAMRMIWNTFLRYEGREYSKEGIHNFYDFITNDQLYFLFLQGKYQLMVALDKGRIIGAGSIRNGNQLSLLFVEEAYHHKGVGSALLRRLCEYLKTEAGKRACLYRRRHRRWVFTASRDLKHCNRKWRFLASG